MSRWPIRAVAAVLHCAQHWERPASLDDVVELLDCAERSAARGCAEAVTLGWLRRVGGEYEVTNEGHRVAPALHAVTPRRVGPRVVQPAVRMPRPAAVPRAERKPDATVVCACGCGQTRSAYDDKGRPLRYIAGHNTQGAESTDDVLDVLADGPMRLRDIADALSPKHSVEAVRGAVVRNMEAGDVVRVAHGVYGLAVHADAVIAAPGVGWACHAALEALMGGASTPTQVARATGTSRDSANKALASLVRTGHAVRVAVGVYEPAETEAA